MEKSTEEIKATDESDLALQISQLQALAAELKVTFASTLQMLTRVEDVNIFLEERVRTCGREWQEQLKHLKETVMIIKEELQGTTTQTRELSERQKEIGAYIETLQQNKIHGQRNIGFTSASNETWNWEYQKTGENYPGDQTQRCKMHPHHECKLHKRHSVSLPHSTFQKVVQSADVDARSNSPVTVYPRHETVSPALSKEFEDHADTDRMDTFEALNQNRCAPRESRLETNYLTAELDKNIQHLKEKYQVKRQHTAVELLKSERLYAFYLSLILKTNVSNRGKGIALNSKNLSGALHSSLRSLTQLHVALLYTLEERVCRWQWQSIVGDIFMKLLNNPEDRFLDNYIMYLKELPECISVLNICGGELLTLTRQLEDNSSKSRPDLLLLLFQPVQRIQEYILLLQNMLKHTEPNHPDCYLLPKCIQHFRIFLSQCSHLLRYNEELLKQRRKHSNRHRMTAAPQNKTRGTEQIQCPRLDETPRRHQRLDKLDPGLLYTSDLGLEYRSPPANVASKTEPLPRKTKDEFNANKTRSTFSQPDKSSIITNPICSSVNCGKNLSPDTQHLMSGASRGKIGYESPVNLEDAEYIHDTSCLDESSVQSSNSSLDVHFTTTLDDISASESEAIDYSSQLTAPHPVGQEGHNKVFRLYCHEANIDVLDVPNSEGFSSKVFTPAPRDNLNFPISLMLTNSESPSLKTKVFDSSQISTSRMKNSQKEISSSPKSKPSDVWMESEKDNSAMVLAFEKSGKFYKEEESKQTTFSEQSGKQEQKGFRNSFRKLFRKKSNQNACSLESKQKSDNTHTQDTAIAGSQESEERAIPVSTFDRGTAV
ncbi:uncharacterized protein LOC144596657 [Rhinoraja longicauda]